MGSTFLDDRAAGRRPERAGREYGVAGAGPVTVVVYGDFGCAFSYLASHRVDALAEVGVEVDWRAVECEPSLPVTGRRLDGDEMHAVRDELEGVLLPGEGLRWRVPGFVPNTEGAVCGYAEARGAGVAAEVRRVLFGAYWVDGADIGSLEVLRRRLAGPILRGRSPSWPLRDFGYAVSPSRGPITTAAWRRVRDWREQWARWGRPRLPVLVRDGGEPTFGAEALRGLADEVDRLGAPLDADLPAPARYSVLPIRPGWW